MAESNINIKPGTQYIGAQHRRTPYFTHDLLSATKVDYDMLAAQLAKGYDYKMETHNNSEIYIEDVCPNIAEVNAQWPDDPTIQKIEEARKKRQGENSNTEENNPK